MPITMQQHNKRNHNSKVISVHAIAAHGEWRYSSTHSLPRNYTKVSGHTHVPFILLPRKSYVLPIRCFYKLKISGLSADERFSSVQILATPSPLPWPWPCFDAVFRASDRKTSQFSVWLSFWNHCGGDKRFDAWQQQDPFPRSPGCSLFSDEDILLLHFVPAAARSDKYTNCCRAACTAFPFENVDSYIFHFCFWQVHLCSFVLSFSLAYSAMLELHYLSIHTTEYEARYTQGLVLTHWRGEKSLALVGLLSTIPWFFQVVSLPQVSPSKSCCAYTTPCFIAFSTVLLFLWRTTPNLT